MYGNIASCALAASLAFNYPVLEATKYGFFLFLVTVIPPRLSPLYVLLSILYIRLGPLVLL
jgi:hypothetical protein